MNPGQCLIAAAALCCLLICPSALADDHAEYSVNWQDGLLSVHGDLSSEGHRDLLKNVIASEWPDADVNLLLTIDNTPPGWSLVTEQALRAIAATRNAELRIDPKSVTVTGLRDEDSDWLVLAARLEATLLPGMQLVDDVAVFDDSPSFSALCREQFMAAKEGRKVTFRRSSAVLSPASKPLLDALVEIATDCPSASILITGHTDASGEEDFNRTLSGQRALAVRNYMVQRGIDVGRFSTVAAGSSMPLTDSNTPAARARNRRIEFDWLMPVE